MSARLADRGELIRKATAEFVGTGFLVATVIGSGIMATNLTDDVGLQLLANSLATGAVLVALIVSLQPVSAAFNPIVTCVEAVFGAVTWRDAGVFSIAQITGGLLGAIVANLMFELDAISVSSRDRSGGGPWLGEVIATLGLVLIIFGAVRARRPDTIPFAVGGYITAAYWFTSSTSFANPAVSIARMFSDTFAGIQPSSVPMFVLMQVVGAAIAVVLVRVLHPEDLSQLPASATDVSPDTARS